MVGTEYNLNDQTITPMEAIDKIFKGEKILAHDTMAGVWVDACMLPLLARPGFLGDSMLAIKDYNFTLPALLCKDGEVYEITIKDKVDGEARDANIPKQIIAVFNGKYKMFTKCKFPMSIQNKWIKNITPFLD